MANYQTHFVFFDKNNNQVADHKYICLQQFNLWLNNCPSAVKGFYDYKTPLTKEQQAIYIEAWAHLWHFGDMLCEPNQIAEDGGYMFDFETTTGFQLYPIYTVLRFMEERDYDIDKIDFDHLKSLFGNRDAIGKYLIKWYYSTAGNSWHSFLPNKYGWELDDFQFTALKTMPTQQVPLRQNTYWRASMKSCDSYFLPSNTE